MAACGVRESLAELLQGPLSGGVTGHVEMQDSASAMDLSQIAVLKRIAGRLFRLGVPVYGPVAHIALPSMCLKLLFATDPLEPAIVQR
jgi:hypothetical protein